MLSCLPGRSRVCAGFTLVEILLVTIILGCVAAGLGATLMSGMRLRERIGNAGTERDLFLIDLQMVARDIRQALDCPEIGFEGDEGRLSFPMLSGGELVRVVYVVDSTAGGLQRTVEKLADIRAGRNVAVTKRALGAGSLVFEYLAAAQDDGFIRQESWSRDQGMARAVVLRGEGRDGKFEKVVFVPAG